MKHMKSYVIPKKFEIALERLERLSNKPVDYHINKALSEYVEDEYDIITADEILQKTSSQNTYSLESLTQALNQHD